MNNQYYLSKEDFIVHQLNADFIKNFYVTDFLQLGLTGLAVHNGICSWLGGIEGIYANEDIFKTFGASVSLKTVEKYIRLLKDTGAYTVEKRNSDASRGNLYQRRYIKCNICAEPWKLPVPWHVKKIVITNRIKNREVK